MFYAKCACVLACCDCFFLCRAFNDIQFLMVCFDLGPNKPFFLRLTTSYMVINWSQSSGAFHLAKIFGSTYWNANETCESVGNFPKQADDHRRYSTGQTIQQNEEMVLRQQTINSLSFALSSTRRFLYARTNKQLYQNTRISLMLSTILRFHYNSVGYSDELKLVQGLCQWNARIHWKFYETSGRPSEVLHSTFFRSDRLEGNITVPFAQNFYFCCLRWKVHLPPY